MFDMEIIGKRLLEERQRLGFKQSDVMSKLHITQATLSRYEHGKRVPTLEACIGLHYIGYDVLYLMTGNRDGTQSVLGGELTPEEQELLTMYRASRDAKSLYRLIKAYNSLD